MGAEFHCEIFDGKFTADQVRREYRTRAAEMANEYGTDPYNGTWSTLDDHVQIHTEVLGSYNAASDFIDARAEKRGCAHAVQYTDVRTETVKEPTFQGKKWHESSHVRVNGPDHESYSTRAVVRCWSPRETGFVAADSLPEPVKAKLTAAAEEWAAKQSAYDAVLGPLASLGQRLALPRLEVTAADFTTMKSLRKQLLKTHAALLKAADKLYALDKKHAEKLYSTAAVNHGTQWLIGGLCAS